MADANPTGDPRVVPVHLAEDQQEILRDELLGWLAGIEEDLADAGPVADPGALLREAAAFRRLLAALDSGRIELPDEEARAVLARAAEGHDETIDYQKVTAVHDAHHALLALLGGGEGSDGR